MKYTTIFLALVLAIAAPAQTLNLAEIGLPAEAIAYQHAVITSQQINNPVVQNVTNTITKATTQRVTWQRTSPGFTAYGLNFLHTYIHDFNCSYRGVVGGWHTFKKDGFNFTTNGQTFTIDPQTLYVKRDAAGLTTFKIVTEKSSYTYTLNRKRVTFTADEMAALAGMTKQVLWERDADFYFASDRNPSTHITSVFVTVAENSGNYTGQVYVNLEPATSYGGRITSYNKSGISYVVRWKFYNDCTAQTASSGGYEKGNFGMCALLGPSAQGTERNPVTHSFNPNREYSVVECMIEELPAQGKNFVAQGYYTVKGCDVDDPCGPARRLPRKPAQ